MNKKLGGSLAALAVALAVVGYMSSRHQARSTATVQPTMPTPAPSATPPQKLVYQPEKEGEVFKTLKGKDFTAKVIISGHLQEPINVITHRDVEADNGPAPKRLKATLELSTRDGQPAYIYRAKAETKPEQTIVFRRNGKIFEDTSGAYRAIADEYNP